MQLLSMKEHETKLHKLVSEMFETNKVTYLLVAMEDKPEATGVLYMYANGPGSLRLVRVIAENLPESMSKMAASDVGMGESGLSQKGMNLLMEAGTLKLRIALASLFLQDDNERGTQEITSKVEKSNK